jgi:hypothetical protein
LLNIGGFSNIHVEKLTALLSKVNKGRKREKYKFKDVK